MTGSIDKEGNVTLEVDDEKFCNDMQNAFDFELAKELRAFLKAKNINNDKVLSILLNEIAIILSMVGGTDIENASAICVFTEKVFDFTHANAHGYHMEACRRSKLS